MRGQRLSRPPPARSRAATLASFGESTQPWLGFQLAHNNSVIFHRRRRDHLCPPHVLIGRRGPAHRHIRSVALRKARKGRAAGINDLRRRHGGKRNEYDRTDRVFFCLGRSLTRLLVPLQPVISRTTSKAGRQRTTKGLTSKPQNS